MAATPIFRRGPFRNFWLAETASSLSQQMVAMAVGWQIYELTNSALSLGLVGLAQFLPQFVFALPGGHVADRYNRRGVMMVCMALQCVMAAALAAAGWLGVLDTLAIYTCVLAIGTAQAFQSPSMRALLPTLVTEQELPGCIAWAAGAKKFATIAGPALGGVIYFVGQNAVYAVAASAMLVAVVLMSRVRLAPVTVHREPATLRSVFAGIAFIRARRVILGAISMDLFATLLGGVIALLPIFARDILHIGPTGLGLLRAAPALGAVIIAAWLARAPLTRGVGRTMFATVATFGCAIIIFGLSTSLPLSLLALVVMGGADMISMVIRTSLVQLETPDAMRGRVSAVSMLFVNTSNQLGQFQAGLAATLFGTVPAVLIGGTLTLVVVVVWMRLFPDLLKRQTLSPGPQ